MPIFSGFWLCLVLLFGAAGFGGGFYVEHLRWVDSEAGRPVAVARVKEEIRVVDTKQVKKLQVQLGSLQHSNDALEEELKYARSQNTGSCSLGPSFVLVWDAKMEGRPVRVPGAASGVPDALPAARDATPDDLLANLSRNAPRLLADRAKLDKLREWSCRVYKVGCPPK